MKTKGKKFKFYNNGLKCIKVYEGDEIPKGYVKGTLNKQTAWNKGLTKEDPRVKANVEKCHSARKEKNNYQAWNKGKKAEEDARVAKNIENMKNTLLDKYGIVNPGQLEHVAWNKGLTKETDKRVNKISKSNKGKIAWNKGLKIGSNWTEESFFKRYMTQLENGTLGKNKDSNAEKNYYEYLLTIYDESDIIKQYYDKERYPFKCDFYIKSEDLFIEVHGNWTHGKMPYIKDNPLCIEQLNDWQEKAKKSNYYKNAIYTWTDLDVRKLETMKKNNLNYQIIYL